ncbi:MAG: hydantoinase/oxoprolinase family protein, partial [Alphaproteobacteria bacterium]|nr:hydantoinase/oxoprolinase family protein [Alphaproteobacteria bacterium]
MKFRIAVDTGGTFTDIVVADENGALTLGKAPSTPERSSIGVIEGLEDAARQMSLGLAELVAGADVLIYGTTWATNAIITGATAKTAMLLTEGFPDILVYRQGGKLHPFEMQIDPLKPYVPRSLTIEVAERINAEGGVERALDEAAVWRSLKRLKKLGVEAVAVCLLWSIKNRAHEARIGELIEHEMPGIPYTLSHRLNPILREYPRASSTAIDASLKPRMQAHLGELQSDLKEIGFAGELLVSTVSGGVMHVEDVAERPIYMVKSGPAMAPRAGLAYAQAEKFDSDVLVVDTGGTTFDVSLVRGGEVKFTRETWLGPLFYGHNLGLSSVDVRSVGAGGGSLAWIDSGGLLRVGPGSAGAVPGPACYGRGGAEPTVTDAAVVLGYIDPDHFLDGRMPLDVDAARAAVGGIAAALDLALDEAAFAILRIASESMIKAIEEITVNEGVNPRESILVAGGGAAGLNILPIAEA